MRILTSFIGFLLAIAVTVYFVAPERLPPGYGFEPVPVELVVESSLAGELVERFTGKSGKNLILKNNSATPIYNLTATLRDENKVIKHQYVETMLPASQLVTLGWARQWEVNPGDELEVKAATFYKVVWSL